MDSATHAELESQRPDRSRASIIPGLVGLWLICLGGGGGFEWYVQQDGGTFPLDLTRHAGKFRVEWFDPRNGGPFVPGVIVPGGAKQSLGAPPDNPNSDQAVRVSRIGAAG